MGGYCFSNSVSVWAPTEVKWIKRSRTGDGRRGEDYKLEESGRGKSH